MNTWLICREIQPKEINPVDRLKLIGKRGMGALEYEPSELIPSVPFREMKIGHLVQITNKTFNQNRDNIEQKDLDILFLVGTSAGGARAKAILLWNPKTNRFYTDKNPDLSDLEHWLIKFDGIHNNRDKDQADPQGYGRIEYAYHLLALEAVIKMTPCRLYHEGGRSHFMTKRFDRTDDVGKLQMQTLGGLAGFDYNQPDKYSYETGGNETRIHQIQKTYRLSLLE
jgi:serine/threonine-protein kinase HipA